MSFLLYCDTDDKNDAAAATADAMSVAVLAALHVLLIHYFCGRSEFRGCLSFGTPRR